MRCFCPRVLAVKHRICKYRDYSRRPFPAGYFLALHGGEFVGTSQLFRSPRRGELRTGLTAVSRTHRRRGIAFGLKAHALKLAKELGYQRVITDNAAENEGMLAINRALGFVRNPAWVRYVKSF